MKHSVLHPKALSLGLMTLLLCVLPQQLRAWDYYIRTNNSHWSTLTPSKPMLGFNVGLGEDDNSGSHPYDDMYHVSLWDIQDPLKIQVDNCAPIDMNDFFKNNTAKLETRYMDYLSQNAKGRVHFYKDNENKWIGSTTTTHGDVVTVGYMWDDGDDDDYYIHVEIYFRNNYPGFRHKVTFSGGWISNGGAPKHVTKIFQDNDIPAIADPFQGTPSYSLAGRKADTVDMQTKFATSANSTVEQFAGVFKEGYSLYIYNTRYQSFDPNAERNNGQFSTPYKTVALTHPASIGKETTDNFSISGFDPSQSHHIYARIAQDVSNRFNTFYGCKNVANNEARFIRDIGDFWLNCYPKVKDLKLSYDKWTKKVRLTWKAGIADKDHATTKGKWVVFREKGKYCKPGTDSMERIATVRYDVSDGATATYEFEDTGSEKSLDYDALYGYQVCFQADEWNEDISRPVQQLSDTLSVRTERNFAFTDFKVSQQPKSIKLEWTHDKLADAGTSHPYLIDIYRKVGAQGTWERLAQHEVKSAGTKTGSYTDSNLQACDQAKYYLCLQNVMGRNVITDSTHTVASSISDSTRILSFTASRGDFDGSVLLQWKLSIVGTQPVTSQILRRQWGSQDSWELQYSVEDTKATSFSYRDDKAATGTYYEYMLVCSTPCTSSGTASVCTQTFDGFALSSGIMNGRISFGSGTAVEGVRVVLQPNGDNAPALFHSMQTDGLGAGSYMAWQPEGDEVPKLLDNNPWTAQLYVKPEWKQSEMTLGEIGGAARLALVPATAAPEDGTEQGTYHPAVYTNGVAHIADSISVRPNQWQQLSFSITPEAGEWSIALYQGRDTALSSQSGVLDSAAEYKVSDNQVVFANDHTLQAANSLAGLIDEIRLFVGHALSPSEISRLADHRLAGTELDLALYWHLDEGIANQPYAYDYSSTDDMRNSRHGNIKYMATSTDTPPDALFSLSGLTDSEGNYSIHGIPFSGSGSNYSVIPVLGGHEFNPSSVSRYVSASSLVHNGLDFTDVSSFKVTGSVRYDRTDIPVADAQIFVDGIAAIRNGKMIATDAQGAFTVDVPIGNHSISVQKQGHVFCDGGRYPADPNDVDTRHLFDRNISGLEFRDSTLVTVAGRVVGGNREGTKPLGFGESTANIGQAVITLKVDGDKSFNMEKQQNEASVKLVPATSQRTYDPASSPASGEAWTGGATDGSPTPTQYITVKTDSLTGEFAVKLPPLLYKVQNVTTASCTFSDATFADIDASNPLLVYTDTLINPYTQAADSFHYCASFKQTYKSRPQLHIEQLRLDTQDLPWDGHFGDSLYIYREEREGGSGEIDSTYVCLYTSTTDADGNRSVQYTFGHPIFTQLGNYGFSLRAYEEYINKDADPNDRKKWLIDHLPLEGDTVKIANPFSVTTGIDRNSNDYLLDNSDGVIALDSLGYGEYYFAVGFPNLAEPYTWPFTATLYSSDEAYTWEQDGQLSDAVVLGNKPFGADFVLLAPDDLVMVLRDPPGSNSQAKWLEGSSVTTGYTRDDRGVFGGGASSLTKAGFGITEYNGSPFVTVRQKTQSLFDFKIGLSAVATNGSAHSHQTTVTATRTITTGTGQAYDGTCDDVFISNSKNILLGKANDIDVHKKKDTSGKDIFYLDKQEVQTTRDSIKTFFTVTQSYIENELIPSFIKLRDAFLETDSQEPLPYKNRARFISNVPKSSPDFGKSGTYTYLPPADLSASMDTVSYYNGQINKWKEHLAYNERVKVHAIRNRDDFEVENIVVSSGVTQTRTVTNDTLTKNPKFWEASSVITTSNTWATSFNEAGQIGIASFQAGYQGKNEDINNHKSTNTIAYTLSDQDVDDYLSVDVYSNADKYGPVFVTIAGATRCPYEGEVRAKYLTGEDADFVIMNATQDVYEPQLTIQNPVITGVPSGKSALLTLQLYNNSSVDKEGTFSLYTTEATNPHGLRLLMDGKPLEPGLTLRVPANQTTYKTIELLQTDPEITDYDSIALNFGPDCDWWRHFSTGYFSVHYLASGTTVDLAATTG
ncbi:MAG: hypothetical protein MJZ43_04630, partial [Bacteroidaceae bacterium]|nr:hypothetical protein [Bacteroidaceae bacterium]